MMSSYPPGSMGVVLLKSPSGTYYVYGIRGSSLDNALIYPGKPFSELWQARKHAINMAKEIARSRQIPIKVWMQDGLGRPADDSPITVFPNEVEITEDQRRFSLIMEN